MGGRRKKKTLHLNEKEVSSWTSNGSVSARNLRKSELGAVIFGCKHHTIKECHNKLLFGLPGPHFAYVKNVHPGLPLFLFNYSDRKLHGIYEATSAGKMEIDKYGWTDDSTHYTPYGAQVRIKVRTRCSPLSEDEFQPIIAENYYELRLFWFELDQAQTQKLISMFTSRKIVSPSLNKAIRQTSFPVPNAGQVATEVFASLDTADVAWGDSYPAIVSGQNTCTPEKKSISCTERKWSSLFQSSNNNGTATNYDGASSSKVPLQSGDFKANNSGWDSIKYEVENQSFEAHNSTWATENYIVDSHVEAFDTYGNLKWLDDDDTKWGHNGKDTCIPEKKSVSCTERKWSSLFVPLNTNGTTPKDDGAFSSTIPLRSGEENLFEANYSRWDSVKCEGENQSFEAHNSMWPTENYNTTCQVEAFDTSCEDGQYRNLKWLDNDAEWGHNGNLPCSDMANADPYVEPLSTETDSECSYYSALEDITSPDVQDLVVKMMEEVEAIKVSHQNLQKEVVDTKAEIQLFKTRYHTLKSRLLPSMEDVEEEMIVQ